MKLEIGNEQACILQCPWDKEGATNSNTKERVFFSY